MPKDKEEKEDNCKDYYILIYYRVVCPACESEFTSYEKYINHVFEKHENQPSLRMKAKIIKKEDNTDCLQTGET
jgi:uncharacterized C2H2 Zn-finger protein